MCLELDTRWSLPHKYIYIHSDIVVQIMFNSSNSIFFFGDPKKLSGLQCLLIFQKTFFVASFPTSPGRDVDISCNQSAMICEGISSVQVTNAKEILEIFANNFREPWLRMGGRSRVGWIRVGFWLWHGYGDLVEVMMWRNYSSKSGVFFKGHEIGRFWIWDQRCNEGISSIMSQFHGYLMMHAQGYSCSLQ